MRIQEIASKSGSTFAQLTPIAALLFIFSAALLNGEQPLPGKIKNFRIPIYGVNDLQMKAVLQGSEAQPLPEGLTLLTEPRLETFSTNGQPELFVQAPQCLQNSTNQAVSSASPLRARTADGKFTIEGEGFLWLPSDSSLAISNHVHTTAHSDVIEQPGMGRTSGNAPATRTIEIYSDRFDYRQNSGLAIYRGRARAQETNLPPFVTADTLTLELPTGGRQLQKITADQNVILDYGEVHATGQRAVYATDTGIMRVAGRPYWRARRMEGRGTELFIDRTNQIFQANGEAWFKMPGRGREGTGFFPPPASGPASAAPPENSFVEIVSRSYEVRTNQAVFRDGVNVKEYAGQQTPNTMTCEVMTALFSSSNDVQKVVAERDVIIEQGDKGFKAAKAVYTATNGLLELAGNPLWRAGEREGRGDRIRVLATNEEMRVEGNATVHLPAHELGPAGPAVTISRPGGKQHSEEQFAEISSHRYTLWPNRALFQGRVRAKHPQVVWACETMTVEAPATNRVIVTAEKAVTFDLADDRGQPVHGSGEKAVYSYSSIGNVTNEVLTLTGHPSVMRRGTNSALVGDIIIYDRPNNKITAPGFKSIQVTNAALGSNSLRLPNFQIGK